MRLIIPLSVFLLINLFSSCKQSEEQSQNNADQGSSDYHIIMANPKPDEKLTRIIPELSHYKTQMQNALSKEIPVLPLAEAEIQDTNQRIAQQIAILDPGFTRDIFHFETGEALRNEIMNIRQALPGDIPENINCAPGSCYRVSMYHYFNNRTSVALVDVDSKKVVFVDRPMGGQPEINKRLTDIAVQIAIHSPEVSEALGIKPSEIEATMPNVKTALNGTTCERSKHLCVAPTFINKNNDRALWAIVDLTEWRLVGVKWTDLGKSGKPGKETERSLQDEYVMEHFCLVDNEVQKSDWNVSYRLTPSDGLEIFDVSFMNNKSIRSAKVVDWHVGYSTKDGFGYSDAMGCPMYSSSAVVAFNGPYTEDIKQQDSITGFALVQDFRSPSWPVPCNYRYQNRFEFYKDGSFRVVCINLGRGCGVDGVYRPIIRIDLASDKRETFSQWQNNTWISWDKENWHLQEANTSYSPEGYLYKTEGADGKGFYIEPGQGQFNDGGKIDNAYTYISRRKPDTEGDVDLMTIGSCCNSDHRQGPEAFLDPQEDILNEDIVIWYVPQMYNSDTPGKEYCWANTIVENGVSVVKTWPGISGPLFVPFGR